jgi:SAM-dependent methyltransferase
MYRSLKERGRAASDYYAGSREYFYLSPAGLSLLQTIQPVVESCCRGRVLDAGAGRGVYRELLAGFAECYVGMDVAPTQATDVLGDAQRLPFADGAFDTVFCSQVLEHVPEPWLALAEFRRVLKPGGHLILTVPHLSWLHNEPHDYYRYTLYGLRFLLAKAGFREKKIVPAGGLLSFLGHIPSAILVNATFGMPVVHRIVIATNSIWGRLIASLDRRLEKNKIYALNYVCLAEKI